MSACASPRRCCIPRENWRASRPLDGRPRVAMSSPTRWRNGGSCTLFNRAARVMAASALPAKTVGASGRNPMRTRLAGSPKVWPSIWPLPEVARRKPIARWIAVVFPAPLGPTNPTISPGSTVSERRSSASNLPYCLLISWNSSGCVTKGLSQMSDGRAGTSMVSLERDTNGYCGQ